MERGKAGGSGRGAKSKVSQHLQDIFALGSKSTVVVPRDSEKRPSIHKPSTSNVERKREPQNFGAPVNKKPRLSSPAEVTTTTTALEVDPVDLVPSVLQALDTHNSDKLLGLLTGSIRLLKSQRAKPEPVLCMSLVYLAKLRPNMFAHEAVAQALCALLRREHGSSYKAKGNPLVHVLACNMLYAAFRDSVSWPEAFIKVYIEDALNERLWVECAWSKCLVENIATAFRTRTPPPHLIPADTSALGTMSPSGSGSPLPGADDDTDSSELQYAVLPRYGASYESVEALVLESIKEQLSRRALDAVGKGFLKLLCATCGFPEIRMISACRLEGWLHSGKVWRCAMELLAYVTCNVQAEGAGAARDHEVLAQLARMRLKTKPLVAAYLACLREMVAPPAPPAVCTPSGAPAPGSAPAPAPAPAPALLRSLLTHTLYNELSNVRSPNNMAVLAALVQAQPLLVPRALADAYLELLLRPDDYLRPLRQVTRECVRGARPDALVALPALARALLAPPPHEPPAELRERMFAAVVDLVCLCCMLCAAHGKGAEYKAPLCAIQAEAVRWLLEAALPLYRPAPHDYLLALHKLTFVEPADSYVKVDSWPAEGERAALHRACAEVPLPHRTLRAILYIGLHKEAGVGGGEALELLEALARRCAQLPDEGALALPLPADGAADGLAEGEGEGEVEELVELVLRLCAYLPAEGAGGPPLAVAALYWRAWLLLTLLAAHNPHSFAPRAYRAYPQLQAFIECCITNKWVVEGTACGESEAEKAAILAVETQLAAAGAGGAAGTAGAAGAGAGAPKLPVTEQTSRLLPQLVVAEPRGPARRPPPHVMDALHQLSAALKLGRLLCRAPALLLDIVERQGTRRAMAWLQQLVVGNQLELGVLPVQCLCEFLAAGGGARAHQLARHLRRTARDSPEGAAAVLGYYAQRLASPHAPTRHAANRGLKLVLAGGAGGSGGSGDDVPDLDWAADVSPEEWLEEVWSMRQWEAVRAEVVARVRAALMVECVPRHLAAYIAFLARHALLHTHHLPDTLLDLSQLLMERMTLVAALLPPAELRPELEAQQQQQQEAQQQQEQDELGPQHTLHRLATLYNTWVAEARAGSEGEGYEWCAGVERVVLQWPGGEHCTVHVVVAHAAVKLLTHGPARLPGGQALWDWAVRTWVGAGDEGGAGGGPRAYLADTSEEACLLPDWLRLHLVRSARAPLVRAGLHRLPAAKLALFIQTFGLPVSSMSALLAALDACSAAQVARLAVERPYMAQLLRVQRARGATGGDVFAANLELLPPSYPPGDDLFAEVPKPPEEHDMWAAEGEGACAGAEEEGAGLPVGGVAALLDAAFPPPPALPLAPRLHAQLAHLHDHMCEEVRALLTGGACEGGAREGGLWCEAVCAWLGAGGGAGARHLPAPAHAHRAVPLLRLLAPLAAPAAPAPAAHAAPALLRLRHALSGGAAALLERSKATQGEAAARLAALARCHLPAAPVAAGTAPPAAPPHRLTEDEIVAALEGASVETLEGVGAAAIEGAESRVVVRAVCRVLRRQQQGRYELPSAAPPAGKARHVLARASLAAGLLLDWLAVLQPEILADEPAPQVPTYTLAACCSPVRAHTASIQQPYGYLAQMRLMFTEGGEGCVWRAQLVTLLVHRASWRTLHACVRALVCGEGERGGWGAGGVLDVCSALRRSPRVWQGRDRATPKHAPQEPALPLPPHHPALLVRLAVREAEGAAAAVRQPASGEAAWRALEARMPLLLEVLGGGGGGGGEQGGRLLRGALEAARLAPERPAAHLLLLLLYMKMPKVYRVLEESGETGQAGARLLQQWGGELELWVARTPAAADTVLHHLLTALAAAGPGGAGPAHTAGGAGTGAHLERAWGAVWGRGWRGAARGLALVAALAGGLGGAHPLHGVAARALELLPAPAAHHPLHAPHAHRLLLALAAACCPGPGPGPGPTPAAAHQLHLPQRLAALLRRYLAHHPQAAQPFIHANRDLFRLPALLLAKVTRERKLQAQFGVSALSEVVGGGWSGEGGGPARPPHAALAALHSLDAPPDALVAAMQEMEAWGVRRGGRWAGWAERACGAASVRCDHERAAVRRAALALLVRAAPELPPAAGASGRAAPRALLHALQGGGAAGGAGGEVRAAEACERLAEAACGCPEHARLLLLRAFELALHAHHGAELHVLHAVSALNHVRGC